MQKVCLWDSPPVILTLFEGGIEFQNQTGGYLCNDSRCYGALYDELEGDEEDQLMDWFFNGHYDGNCWSGIDEETADFIDALLLAYYRREMTATFWQVNREKMEKSHEAWIYLIEPSGAEGILTWRNSD